MGDGLGTASEAALEHFDDPETGGVWYSVGAGNEEPDFVHCEIAGYALAEAVRENDRMRARRLAQFLVASQSADGTFPHSVRSGGSQPSRAGERHAFDAGICAGALLDEGGSDSAAAARAALARVASAMNADGSLPARLDGEAHNRAGWWSDDGGCYMGKLAPVLARAGHVDESNRLVAFLLAGQRADGAWNAAPRCRRVHSHAMCYALEGLALQCERSPDPAIADTARRGIDWLAERAVADGGLLEWPDDPSRRRAWRSDAQVQMLRLLRWPRCKTTELHAAAARACHERLRTLETQRGWAFADGSPRVPAWTILFHRSLVHMDCMPWKDAIL